MFWNSVANTESWRSRPVFLRRILLAAGKELGHSRKPGRETQPRILPGLESLTAESKTIKALSNLEDALCATGSLGVSAEQ